MARKAWLAVFAWLCLGLSLAGCTAAQALTFPALTGRVVDQAGLLSAGDLAGLNASLAALEAKNGDQLVVVTLKSLQGTTIEDYGYQLGRNWGIGQKGRNNGALLIVAPAERKVRIEVGYGLEGTLTDAATRLIIENAILPHFRTGDFAGGIVSGAAEIIRALGGDPGDGQPASGWAPGPRAAAQDVAQQDAGIWPFIVVGLGVVGLLIVCAVAFGGGLCGGILRTLALVLLSGRGGGSQGSGSSSGSSFSGGGGSFGGGGSSGSW